MTERRPIMLFAAILLIVGASAALPAALFLRANAESRVAVDGEAETGASPVVHAEPLPSAAAPTAPSAVPSAAPSAAPSAKAANADADAPGFLTINTVPHARVSEHGRVLCTATPCAHLALAPGVHTITVENKEESLKNSITVTITSGETTSKRFSLKP